MISCCVKVVFGKLIAPLLQGQVRKKGNSLFVDEAFEPYSDQWAYLSEIKSCGRRMRKGSSEYTVMVTPLEIFALWIQQPSPGRRNRPFPFRRWISMGYSILSGRICFIYQPTDSRPERGISCFGWQRSGILNFTNLRPCGCRSMISPGSSAPQRNGRDTWRCQDAANRLWWSSWKMQERLAKSQTGPLGAIPSGPASRGCCARSRCLRRRRYWNTITVYKKHKYVYAL